MAELDPVFVDADPVTGLPTMSAQEMRATNDIFQQGVFGSGDMKVTPAAAAAGRPTVDVAAGRGVVQSTVGGVYLPGKYIITNDAVVNSEAIARSDGSGNGIPANGSANPRLDALVARVWDHTLDGLNLRRWRYQWVTGVAGVGVALGGTLPALPASSMLVCEALVPGGNPSTIPAANIRDRRSWARGAQKYVTRKANAGGTADYTTTSASFVSVDATNLARRIECGGPPMKLRVTGRWQNSGTSRMVMAMYDNGVQFDGETGPILIPGAAATPEDFDFEWRIVMTPGSHVFEPKWLVFGGTGTLLANTGVPFQFTTEEIVRQDADNT